MERLKKSVPNSQAYRNVPSQKWRVVASGMMYWYIGFNASTAQSSSFLMLRLFTVAVAHGAQPEEMSMWSSNMALNLAPFGRWTTLKRRRLPLRYAT